MSLSNFTFTRHNEWPPLLDAAWNRWVLGLDESGYKWHNFTAALLSFENNTYFGFWELSIVVLGFGIQMSYLYNRDADGRKHLERMISDLERELGEDV